MRPLEGYRVFDFTAAKSGPMCTAILADFGAEVIDIENPAILDPTRKMKPQLINNSTEFCSIHRGKKNLQLNTKTPEGLKIAQELIKSCDVFVENGKPGSAAKMGLGYEDVKKIRPDIVYASISGFGQDGPYRDRVAYDTVIQAMSGFMSLTGPESGEFTKAGPSASDIFTGFCGALGIAMALIRRERTGEGTYLDCAMLDCFIALQDAALAAYLRTGEERRPMGNKHPANCIAEPVKCKDGEFILQMFGEEMHRRFFSVMGMPDLTQDPRFSSGPNRVQNREVLIKEYVEPVLANYTLAEISKILRENKIPCGEMYTIKQLVEDEHFKARAHVIPCRDSLNGDVQIYGSPFKYNNFDMPKETFCDQPGEHNREILREMLGMSEEEITAALTAMGANTQL